MKPTKFQVGKLYRARNGKLYRVLNMEEPRGDSWGKHHIGRQIVKFLRVEIKNGRLEEDPDRGNYTCRWGCGSHDYNRPMADDSDIIPEEVTLEDIFPVQYTFVKPSAAQRALEL